MNQTVSQQNIFCKVNLTNKQRAINMKTFFLLSLLFAPLMVHSNRNVVREDAPDEETSIEPYGNDPRRLGYYYGFGSGKPLPDIEYWIVNRGSFSTVATLLVQADLAPQGILAQDGDYTVFAPSNMAFRNTFRIYPGL